MERSHPPIQSLIAEARRYARFTMKKSGGIAPVMLASAAQGLIYFCPESMRDGSAKDDCATKALLDAMGVKIGKCVGRWFASPRSKREANGNAAMTAKQQWRHDLNHFPKSSRPAFLPGSPASMMARCAPAMS